MKWRQRWAHGFGASIIVVAAASGACGGGGSGALARRDAGSSPAHDGGLGHEGGLSFGHTLTSITVDPPTATITSDNGAIARQGFSVVGHYSDGSSSAITTASWSADQPQIGSIDGSGTLTASGALGGLVTVGASANGQSATATLTVVLDLSENPAGLPPAVRTALTGATVPDATCVWAYPYDGTVWPRGLLPPLLQWNGGAATDDYYVHVESATFTLSLFTTATNAPASRLALDPTTWEKLTDSTAGAATVTVARWDGSKATRIARQTWTIASGSMRGTIYYWSNDLGRVLRIQPGASAPDDFANQPPLSDPTKYQQDSCLMTCHTVSADGSTLLSGGGTFGGSYDLKTDMPIYSLGGTWGSNPNAFGQPEWENIAWYQSALSPTGKYVLVNSMGQGGVSATGGPATDMGLFTTVDGKVVSSSGVMGVPFTEPAWSPEGSRVVYVDSGDPSTWGGNWQTPPAGDLKVIQFDETKSPMFSGVQTLIPVGTSSLVTWPTVSPDGQWVLYGRGGSADTRQGPSDLYFASAVTPGHEVRLHQLDGDGYPFAAGTRDLSLNYEPSFAPVAAGGYFWVVFTSRRTYGNVLTGQPFPCSTTPCTEVKQLWVAAIDENPKLGVDPSHPAFYLTGQNEANLAMRGFWSLPPCKTDGASCATGTECCGGYCSPGAADAGADGGGNPVCQSMTSGCATDGERCSTSSDCCDVSSGATCINHFCAGAAPK